MCFIFGLVVGSFLNVVIARLPMERSIVHPRSACPDCGAAIRWYDNLPVVSWLSLRGRCRACHHPISRRYPTVELLTGILFALAAWHAATVLDLVAAMVFLAALVVISGIDLDHQIIPDIITLPGIVVGALLSLLGSPKSWLDVLLGILVGGGPFVLIILLTAGRGMGGGDPKLGAMIGAFLGWKLALLAILIGVWSGGAVAIALLATGRKGRKAAIPFGPFLALGGMISLLWGGRLLVWYLGG